MIFVSYATQCQNFRFKLRRNHRKKIYDSRGYESVDDKSLSNLLGSISRLRNLKE